MTLMTITLIACSPNAALIDICVYLLRIDTQAEQEDRDIKMAPK